MSQAAWAENYSMGFFREAFPFLEPSQKNSLSRRTSSEATRIETHERTLFKLKPKFLRVIQSVERYYQSQKVFTFKEVAKLLSKYICSRKDSIFDIRNLTVALVSTDPLGEAFELQAFHRNQIHGLMLKQMTPTTTRRNPRRCTTGSQRKLPYTCK